MITMSSRYSGLKLSYSGKANLFISTLSIIKSRQPFVSNFCAVAPVDIRKNILVFWKRHADWLENLGQMTVIAGNLLPIDITQLRCSSSLDQHTAFVFKYMKILVKLGQQSGTTTNRLQTVVAKRSQPVCPLDLFTHMA